MSFTDQMKSLPQKTFITIRDPETAKEVRLQVVTPEKFIALKQFGSSQWKPDGTEWIGVICDSQPDWLKTPVLLLQMNTTGYLLRRRQMSDEEPSQYAPSAEKFGHQKQGQIAGSVELPYQGKVLKIQDIGMWTVKAHFGAPHIPDGTGARWIVAHGDDNFAVVIEDQVNGNHDSAWEGWVVDLNRVVRNVLTPNGQ